MPDVTFYSNRFCDAPRADAINNMLGHDVAEWLQTGLYGAGFEVDPVKPLDHGFGYWAVLDGGRCWLTHTQYEPGDGGASPKWLVGVDGAPGCFALPATRHRQSRALYIAVYVIHNMLIDDKSVDGITWWMRSAGRGQPSASPPNHQ